MMRSRKRSLLMVVVLILVFSSIGGSLAVAVSDDDVPKLNSLCISGYQLIPDFSPSQYDYDLTVNLANNASSVALTVVKEEDLATVSAEYQLKNGNTKTVELASGIEKSLTGIKTGLTELAVKVSLAEKMTIYNINLVKNAVVNSLALNVDGNDFAMNQTFSPSVYDYTGCLKIGSILHITPVANDNTIQIKVNDEELIDGSVDMTIEDGINTIEITAAALDGNGLVTYTLCISGLAEVGVDFTVDPANANLVLTDGVGTVIQPTYQSNGEYAFTTLLTSQIYNYSVSKSGYLSQNGSIVAGEDICKNITLIELGGAGLPDLDSYWPNNRRSNNNMAIVSAAVPRTIAEVSVKWLKQLGSDYQNAPSSAIIVEDYLVLMSGDKLYKISLADGSQLASAQMAAVSDWGYTPPTYGAGMIFVPLTGGVVQAFNADTMESLWIYTDSIGGQSMTPITYDDGYIYTGFWISETASANYVCLSVTDEDIESSTEAKSAVWKFSHRGGFYWAGAVVVDDYLLFSADDGDSGYQGSGMLYSLNKANGSVADSKTIIGDGRSSIVSSGEKLYFTTKAGYLYVAELTEDGCFNNINYQSYGNQSTGSPIIYQDRVYFATGVLNGNDNSLIVADAETLLPIYTVPVNGYPQGAPLLSTAYLQSTGKCYVYFTLNDNCGSLVVLEDSAGQTDAAFSTIFSPKQMQYCIASPICDKQGTIYYKNDSGYYFALAAQFAVNIGDNQHGTISLDKDCVAVGDMVSFSVSAHQGYQVAAVYCDGEELLPNDDGIYHCQMRSGGVTVSATYSQQENSIMAIVSAPQTSISISGLSAVLQDDIAACLDSLVVEGFNNAVNSFISGIAAKYENNSAYDGKLVEIRLYLAVEAIDIEMNEGEIYSLILDIKPMYQVFVDGVAISDGGKINNIDITEKMELTIDAPDAMNPNQPRVVHGDEVYIPEYKSGKFSFSVDSFSKFELVADGLLTEIKYYLNEGTATGISNGKTINYYLEDQGSKLPEPSRKNYVFDGWYDNSSFSGKVYTAISADLPDQLYAKWTEAATIKVSFRLIGDTDHEDGVANHQNYLTWIKTTTYVLPQDSKVYDLFVKAIDDAGLSQKGADNDYVSSIKAPSEFGGFWLGEFDNGPNSGWMYTVNGDHPGYGLKNWQLYDGDKIIWHYVDDYRQESSFEGNPTTYLNRWLEAEDISPAEYIAKYGSDNILTVGTGGTVVPSGDLSGYINKNVTFTITADAGYQIKDVNVDGVSQGAIASYTYKNLRENSRIVISFERITDAGYYFVDVPQSHWAAEWIYLLSEKGLVKGKSSTLFAPSDSISRAELVAILSRMSGDVLSAYTGVFQDVAADSWNAANVGWAIHAGVAQGVSQNIFSPNSPITRQDLAVMLLRYAEYKGFSFAVNDPLCLFGDDAAIAGYAKQAVCTMQQAGIISGKGNNLFAPLAAASRAEAAKMLALIYQISNVSSN